MTAHPDTLRVLIVDDEPLISWSLAETLRDCGDEVTEAPSGATALRALAASTIDVVLLDFHLPDSHDLHLLTTVKRIAPASQVILMSAFCTPETASDALAHGACRVITKPIDMDDVPTIVHGAAGARPH
jgi:DNA-binding NtrC family response regulator